MPDQTSKNAILTVASESSIWMQKLADHPDGSVESATGKYFGAFRTQDDAVHLKGSPSPAKPNPFVQVQVALSQTPISSSVPAKSKQGKP